MRQCPSCLSAMHQSGSEGRTLPSGEVEETTHWRCGCGQQFVDVQVHGVNGTDGGHDREAAQIEELNGKINRLKHRMQIASLDAGYRVGNPWEAMAAERLGMLRRRRKRLTEQRVARERDARAERARRLAHEASPLGQLDLAIDRVRAAGRGEPWAADDPHWTEREPTDRQRQFLESRGMKVPATRGAASREIGQVKEREANPVVQASSHVAVDAQGNTLRVDQGTTLDRLVVDRLGARLGARMA